ncbi:MAG: hypothetical protein J6S71_09275 [Clostridia bacterium]|nr:hypothetical protein [Clostridia bacterium]
MDTWEIVYNWLVFLGQVALIVLGCVLLYFIYRYLRTIKKRMKAVKNLKKSAERAGFKCKKTGSYLNFDSHNMETCFVLTRELMQYNVRFLTTFGKNRTLRFLAPDAYVSEKTVGYMLLINHRNVFGHMMARMFKPKNIPGDLLKWTHSETVTFPSNTIYTKGVEVLQSGNVREVVILNPVPLKAFYLDKTTWKQIIGGETWQNLSFHDISSFCSLIERT